MFQLLLINQSQGINISKELETIRRLYNFNESSQLGELTESFGYKEGFTTTASIIREKFYVTSGTSTMEVQDSTKYPRYIPVMNPGSRFSHT